MEDDDDTSDVLAPNPANDRLARILRWLGLICGVGCLMLAIAVAA